MKKNQISLFIITALLSIPVWAHGKVSSVAKDDNSEGLIIFPDVEGRLTLISDLHTHSVFSDGHVWPNIRVSEAQRNGLDVLAITEHLEYQPHIAQIPHKDRNSAFLEANKAAKGSSLVVLAGSEITREMPPGHMNAIFLEDSNKLLNLDKKNLAEAQRRLKEQSFDVKGRDKNVVDFFALANVWPAEEAVAAANKQGAFVFWNHPMWSSQAKDGVARLTNMHKKFITDGKLHGIEIVNGSTYSEEAFRIAIENNLALIGTSDVHNLIEWDYLTRIGEHRPVTLIFAKDRSKESIKEALFQRRTVIWFKEILIGKEDNLLPLLESIISIESTGYDKGTQILTVIIKNNSSARLQLKNQSRFTFFDSTNLIDLPGNDKVKLRIKTLKKLDNLQLEFEVLNALIAPDKNSRVIVNTKI